MFDATELKVSFRCSTKLPEISYKSHVYSNTLNLPQHNCANLNFLLYFI